MKFLFKLNTINKALLLLLVIALLHFVCRKFYLIEGNSPTCITSSELTKTDNNLNDSMKALENNFTKQISDLNNKLTQISSQCSEANKKASATAKQCSKTASFKN